MIVSSAGEGPIIFSGDGRRVVEVEYLEYEGPDVDIDFYGRRGSRRVPVINSDSMFLRPYWNHLTPRGIRQGRRERVS